VTGTNVLSQSDSGARSFEFRRGPIFANIVLADEINRATPKTQSALLEAMQEHRVTVAKTSYTLERPFFVMATQNPIEMEGTYPLPEAQLDRFFFKLTVTYPTDEELLTIAERTTSSRPPQAEPVADGATVISMMDLARDVPIARPVLSYAVRLTTRTHPDKPDASETVKRYVRYGASPRGLQSLVLGAKIRSILEGRFNVAFEDIREVALPALRHRIILNFEADAEGVTADRIIQDVMLATKEE
jgi:MoxR-like ATPase